MLIEIHMIQNHSPANLNRDDLGAPKTCMFGGVTRARISSQCLKRSIRRSEQFQEALEKDGGVRTRRLITVLAEGAHGSSPAPDDLIKLVTDAFEKGGVKKKPTQEDANATNILMFVPRSTVDAMAGAVKTEWKKAAKQRSPVALARALTELLGQKATIPDLALCGRMTELDSQGLFAKIDFHVEAALSASHAISTHEAINEVDYFTAADDFPAGTGAGHVNEAMYASACFYKYFCLSWDQLLENLGGDAKLAELTVRQFMRAAALTTPSGKQHAFAASNLPDGLLVEVKTDKCVPVNYANAFAEPIPQGPSRNVIEESIAALGQYVHDLTEGYNLQAQRWWFSPSGRYPLTYVRRDGAESEKQQAVLPARDNLGSFDSLVDKVMEAVSAGAKASKKGG